jgi:flagellar motor switch protein FliG
MTQTSESVSVSVTGPALSGPTKAAMFLMGIGEPMSAELLRQLDSDEIRKITSEISGLEAVAPKHMLRVFREFETLAGSSRYFAKGGAGFARKLIEQALGPEHASKLLDASVPASPGRAEASPSSGAEAVNPELQILHQTEPRQLATFLRNENPQTIALVLSNMPPEAGAALLKLLPTALQAQTALRMATLDRASPEVFRKITEAIGSKLKAIRQVSRSDGMRSLAGLLNHIEPELAESILTQVELENQTTANSVRELMFTFDDILNIDKQGMKALASQLDPKILTLALKGAATKMREHFTQTMSQRSAEMLAEDIEALGAVRIRDVQAAQQQVVALVRQLQQQGSIATGSAGGDEYVV